MKMAETAWNADLWSAQRARRPAGGVPPCALGDGAPEASPPPICTEGENHPAGRRRAVRCAVAQRDEGTRHA